jgi:hypothetical protein
MKKIKIFMLITLVFLALTNCSPSSEQIATAVKATLEAQSTPTPMVTSTLTLTPTLTITLSPTPDARIAMAEPKMLVLAKTDLPKGGDYIIPNELWSSPVTNETIIQNRNQEKGSEYLAKSGRVTGWQISFVRRNRSIGAQYPMEIDNEVVQFKTAAGATWANMQTASEVNSGYQLITLPNGDQAYTKESSFTATADMYLHGYDLEEVDVDIAHRNYIVDINIEGIQGSNEVSRDMAVSYAMLIIQRIDNAELYSSWVD